MARLHFLTYGVIALLVQQLVECSDSCGEIFVRPSLEIGGRRGIVGGTTAEAHSFPWMVSIHDRRDGTFEHLCGASLLRVNDKDESDIIISAAHCFYADSSEYRAIIGGHNQKLKSNEQIDAEIENILVHPQYESHDNDLALLKLKRPVKFSNSVQPICLPKQGDHPPARTAGIAIGWGNINEKPIQRTDQLQQVMLPVISDAECEAYYPEGFKMQYMFCAGYKAGVRDTCRGDSGGPYMTKLNDRFYLTGITSWGAYECGERDSPGVYVRVANYVDWIQAEAKRMTSLKSD